MSVERHVVLIVCGLCVGMAAAAEERPAPEVEFLEYLGTWEQTDEEWLLHDIEETADTDERSDPAPEGEESTESKDES